MEEKHITPIKAIRQKCLDCSNGSAKEVKQCPASGCPLQPFRLGKNPNRAGKGGKGAHKQENTNLAQVSAENTGQEVQHHAPNYDHS